MGLWTWARVGEALKLVPELLFLRDFHVTQAGILAASAMGAKIDKRPDELMHPGSVPEGMRAASAGGFRLRLHGAEEAAFRLGLKRGVISQRLLNLFSA